ncbi:UvrD-helicase domain-containing protein [Streptomyces sp. A1136]|uniref:UvrD-helicase domain-containing protein n=1 Tax=Streptomyces sp. A1136 TaxID=2563102 RepID=UPI00109E7CDE|nr:UvrD-helicase domain-containing protein [Streptomyces sp. A1136]THA55142.1 ATP-dependent helicase [Streptomyces sp. A1136]
MSARPAGPPALTDPEQLKELLGIPFTPEQLACATAPAAPQVIVAGAGSGKTTVMAARVVWLVGTGAVAPEQVLGLTFTNKAAGELAERVRKALARAGISDPDPFPDPFPDPSSAGRAGRAGTEPGAAAGEPRISTYHAFAGQLLKDHGLRIGLEPSARLLADATRFQLAARVLREAPGPYPSLTKSLPDLVSDVLALDAELSEHLVAPEELRTYDTRLLDELAGTKLTNDDLRKVPEAVRGRLELLELTERYRDAKRSRDLLDFSDQIALSARLATTRPEVGALLREEFRVVLLDEYQDTSVAQRLLLSGLFGAGTGHAVTAVGDPCQAIYGWRGASVANLDDFPEHFPNADGSPAARQSLSENRRSGGRLLDLANGLAAPLRAMHEGVEALRPAPGEERSGSVRCALLPTHAEELEWLGDSVAHLVRTGTAPGEIAVLCRSAGDFARIQAVLVAREVPVEVVGLSGLLHLPEVADLVAVCEVLQDPGANASLVRLLTGPRWRIGARDLALLGRRARQLVNGRPSGGADADPDARLAAAVEGVDPVEVVSLADALETFLDSAGAVAGEDLPFSAEARVRFAHLAQELRDLRRSLADPLMDVLHRVLAATGLDVELSASPHALAARRRETLSGFLDVAAGFASLDGEASLLAFLAFLRTAAQYEKGLDHALPGGENTVKVLTAHKSKGLEWDVVVVPGLCAGAFPKEKPPEAWTSYAKVLPYALRGDAATLPGDPAWTSAGLKSFKAGLKEHKAVEELRLGYVTFTRPRSLLLASGHWWGPTQKKPRGPSAFLEALYAHCEAGHGEIEAWASEPEPEEENPVLTEAATADHAWPLPLDPASLARRRRAAALVESHISAGYLWPPHCEEPSYDPPSRPDPTLPPPRTADAAPATVPDDDLWPEPEAAAWSPTPPDGPGPWADSAVPTDAPGPAHDATGDRRSPSALPADAVGPQAHATASGDALPGDAVGPQGPAAVPDDELWPEAEAASWSVRPPQAGGPHSAPAGPEAHPAASGGAPGPGGRVVPAARVPGPQAHAAEPGGGLWSAAAGLSAEEARAVASWDRDLDALEGELRRTRTAVRDVELPASLSASQLLRLAADEQGFARELARPMPKPPQPAARQGTRFHAWVESRFDELPLPLLDVLDPATELPGAASDQDIADEADLASLKAAFERSEYADRTPHRMEAPVQLTLAGRVVRGRIDAVYKNPDGSYEIVDWKTGRTTEADPLQLAVYRLAWAEATETPLDRVSAAFLHVRSGRVIRPRDLPDRARLERILQGKTGTDSGPRADG